MTCPVCGEPHPCVHDADASPQAETQQLTAESGPLAGAAAASAEGRGQAWRQEIASRVRQHRARRRGNADPNALELDFTAEEPYSFAAAPLPPPPARFAEIVVSAPATKVIRFPRSSLTPPPAIEEVTFAELGAPILDAPRIVDASPMEGLDESPVMEPAPPVTVEAEQMDLLPSFDDIHLEPPEDMDDDAELIPYPAPLAQRIVAGAVDTAIVIAATAVCAMTFLQLAEETPQSRFALVSALAGLATFWLVFQYLFLVHGSGTPGMRLAQLELRLFDGGKPGVAARRSRALASTLAGFAAGLGYLWAFIDEDRVGWHDRISQTYLRALPEVQDGARDRYLHDDLDRGQQQ